MTQSIKQDHGLYLGFAKEIAKRSKATRKKVGAVLVTNSGVILSGYNGTATGCDNCCEEWVEENGGYLRTKQEVIHAELNCILKAAREGVSVIDSVCYTTLAPCIQCSAMLIQAGVKEVHYIEEYRDTKGVELLKTRMNVLKHN